MKRFLFSGLVAILLLLTGYGVADRLERKSLWQDDRLIAHQTSGKELRFGPDVSPRRKSRIVFDDVAAAFGVNFTYYDGAAGYFYIVETTGGGMGVLDYDHDGNPDVYLVNGSRLPVDPTDRTQRSRLFRNRGELGFEDVTEPAGVDLVSYGQGATVGDYDNDGFEDLFVTGFGRTVLYHNNGDGTFTELTLVAGLATQFWSTSAAFADVDQDGALDLYVCTYGEVSLQNPLFCERGGQRVHCLPRRYPAQPDLLFHNQGDGTFAERSAQAGVVDENGRGLGVVIADFTSDDRPDIFVANDTSENFLFVGQGGLRFEDRALSLGVALTGEGSTMSGMGVACGDYDRNGFLDLFVTNFYGLGWGTVFIDADLDGFPDLFVANGHVSDLRHERIPYKMRQQFYRNAGNGKFEDVSESAGPYFRQLQLGRGVAWADINNDGLPDLVVSHIVDPVTLLLNQTREHGHWIGLRLVGTRSNRNGLNAKVLITVEGAVRSYELVAGGGYLSSSDLRLLVGLGQVDHLDQVVVRWPSGQEDNLYSLAVDRYHVLREAR
ncbi:MAG: CRTAC1 family protein [Planctomycetes bacterium]|nr:CRTAC1 family protein [Planctomycetota bacterium]